MTPPVPDRSASQRKHPEFLRVLVAWLEDRSVSVHALELLLPIHRNEWLRPEIEAKLRSLDFSRPIEADLFQRVNLALDLFTAVDAGHYPVPRDWAELEPSLSRALAYFVNNTDAIPDHFADGFEDDHREFVDMATRLGALLDHFEVWNNHRKGARPSAA